MNSFSNPEKIHIRKRKKDRKLQLAFLSLLTAILIMCSVLAVMVTNYAALRAKQAAAASENTYASETASSETKTRTAQVSSQAEKESGTSGKEGTEEREDAAEILETFSVVSAREPKTYSGLILIGDSRMVMLQRSAETSERDLFIAKGAMSYDWFESTAVPNLRSYLTNDPDYAVVVMMGVNDCANNCAGWTEYFVNDYIQLINSLAMDFPFTDFYFASVGHIKNYYLSTHGELPADEVNAYIDIFNSFMEERCLATYIDVCEHLDTVGYSWADNVHYSKTTSQEIYDYISDAIYGG